MSRLTPEERNALIQKCLETRGGREKIAGSLLQPTRLRLESTCLLWRVFTFQPRVVLGPVEGEDHLGHWEADIRVPRKAVEEGKLDLIERGMQKAYTGLKWMAEGVLLERLSDIGHHTKELPDREEAGTMLLNALTFARLLKSQREAIDPINQMEMIRTGTIGIWGRKRPILVSSVVPNGEIIILPPPEELGSLRSDLKVELRDEFWEGIPDVEPPQLVIRFSLDIWVKWHPTPEAAFLNAETLDD